MDDAISTLGAAFAAIWGTQFIPSPYMADCKQFRFPKSKKARVRKKWAKRTENWRMVPWPHLMQMGNTFLGHPATIAKVKARIAKEERPCLTSD